MNEKNTEELILQLQDQKWKIRRSAISPLAKIGSADARNALIPLLQDQSSDIRARTAEALGQLRSKDAVPDMIQLLHDENTNVYLKAARALGMIGTPEAIKAVENIVPELIQLFQEPLWKFRANAVEAIGQIGKNALDAVPALMQLLYQDPYETVRKYVFRALGRIGVKDAIPDMIQFLQDEGEAIEVRKNAARALDKIGAKDAIPDMIQVLQDKNGEVRAHVSEALCGIAKKLRTINIGEENIVDTVIPMLLDPFPLVRSRTAHALGRIGSSAKNADIYLIHLLKDPDDRVRKDAEWALEKINTPDARRALRYGTEN